MWVLLDWSCGCGDLGGCFVWSVSFGNWPFTVLIWWLCLLWLFGVVGVGYVVVICFEFGFTWLWVWVVWVVVFYWLLWFTGGWILCMLLDFVGVCGVIGYGFCHFVVDATFLVGLLVLIDGVWFWVYGVAGLWFIWRFWCGGYFVVACLGCCVAVLRFGVVVWVVLCLRWVGCLVLIVLFLFLIFICLFCLL